LPFAFCLLPFAFCLLPFVSKNKKRIQAQLDILIFKFLLYIRYNTIY
jgi:hypothetical protein